MALLKCNECGNMVSENADKCPVCGNPIRLIKKVNTAEKKQKEKFLKKSNKKQWMWGIGLVVIITCIVGVIFGVKNSRRDRNVIDKEIETEVNTENALVYEKAEIKTIKSNNSANGKKYSILVLDSGACTDEFLEDWYYNYVCDSDYYYYIILYSDKNDNTGCYASKGVVKKDQQFVVNEDGTYVCADSANAVIYYPNDGKEKKLIKSEGVENTQSNNDDGYTMGQKNALVKALQYLEYGGFSYNSLVDQLEFEQFSEEDAIFAADHCGADWNEQAAMKAKSYLDHFAFSRDQLIDQLESEGFTESQAEYGVQAVGY